MLVPKKTKKNSKLFIKTNKNIFIKYKFNNNYLIYLSNQNKIISIKNCLIKENLIYSNDYNLVNNNYTSLEKLELLYNNLDILENYQFGGNININNLSYNNSPTTNHLPCNTNGLPCNTGDLPCNIEDLPYNTSGLSGNNLSNIRNLFGKFDKNLLLFNNFINNLFNSSDSDIKILDIENNLDKLSLNYNKFFKK